MNDKSIYKKIIILITLILFLISNFGQMKQQVEAHSVYYLAVTVDTSNMLYTGNVFQDDESFWSRESKHMEFQIGTFDDIKMDNRNVGAFKDGKIDLSNVKSDGGKDNLVYSLPAKEDGNNHATQVDIDNLYLASDYLVLGLNDAINFTTKGKKLTSKTKMRELSEKLAMATGLSSPINKFTWDAEVYTTKIGAPSGFKVKKGFKSEDYIVITRESDKAEIIVPYQLKKVSSTDKYYNAPYWSWTGFMLHAWKAADLSDGGIYTQNISVLSKPSKLTEMIVDTLGEFTNQIRSLLGLYSINDLIFNEGTRGGYSFVYGVAPKGWIDNTLTYHMIFQGFAMTLLLFAIVKTLLQRNLATVNTNIRVSLIEGFQNIIVAAILLALIIPLMNAFMYLNFTITQFFGTTVPEYSAISNVAENGGANYTNLLGGVVMQLVYFIIGIYYNFIYIIRAVTVTLLIALVPLFIVVYAFGGQWKGYFWQWFKEFIANVFMQSFHAMMLSLFYSFSMNNRGIEGIVVLMAIIPLSNFFRQMIFGGAGDATNSIGGNAFSAVSALGVSGFQQANKLMPSRNKNADVATSKNGSTNSNTSGNTATNTNSKASTNASKLKTSTTNGSSKEASMDTSRVVSPVKPDNESQHTTSAASLQQRMNDTNKSGKLRQVVQGAKTGIKPFAKGGKVAAQGVGDVARLGAGLAAFAAGTGTSLALGGENFNYVKAGQNMGNAGTATFEKGKDGLKSDAKNAYDAFKNRNNKEIDVEQHSNGDIGVSESLDTFKGTEKGELIADAYVDADRNQVIHYNSEQFTPSQKEMMVDMQKAYYNNETEKIETYRKMGIQNIGHANGGKEFVITYNQEGKRQMGIRSMEMDKKKNRVNTVYAPGGNIGDNKEAAMIKPQLAEHYIKAEAIANDRKKQLDPNYKPPTKPKNTR